MVHLLARIRLTMARHPWIYWVVVAVVAGAVATGTARAMAGVDAQRRSWGQQATVWVASAAIEPGQPIRSDRRQVPRAVVPTGAIKVAPEDVVARQRIANGEIITDLDVAAPGPAGLIPDGWVAFAVPVPVAHLDSGDHVRVYAADQFVAAGVVVDDGDSESMVAIPVEAAPVMATALLADTVTIALTPGP
jgi:hypothetical protein